MRTRITDQRTVLRLKKFHPWIGSNLNDYAVFLRPSFLFDWGNSLKMITKVIFSLNSFKWISIFLSKTNKILWPDFLRHMKQHVWEKYLILILPLSIGSIHIKKIVCIHFENRFYFFIKKNGLLQCLVKWTTLWLV